MNLGLLLVVAFYAILVATALAGGVFVRRLSGRYTSWLDVLKSTLSWFKLFKNPLFLAILALTLVGLGLIMNSYTVRSTTSEQTSYRYLLGEQPIHWWMDTWVLTVYKYRLYEFPVKTIQIFYDSYFKPCEFFLGAALVIAALILTAYWLAKANNLKYGAKTFPWEARA